MQSERSRLGFDRCGELISNLVLARRKDTLEVASKFGSAAPADGAGEAARVWSAATGGSCSVEDTLTSAGLPSSPGLNWAPSTAAIGACSALAGSAAGATGAGTAASAGCGMGFVSGLG